MKKFSLIFLLNFTMLHYSALVLSQPLPSTTTETGLTIHPEQPNPASAITGAADSEVRGEMDVDVDTGSTAAGAMDVDVDALATGMDETGVLDQEGTYGSSGSLPDTASDAPLVGILGMLLLLMAVAIRLIPRRRQG